MVLREPTSFVGPTRHLRDNVCVGLPRRSVLRTLPDHSPTRISCLQGVRTHLCPGRKRIRQNRHGSWRVSFYTSGPHTLEYRLEAVSTGFEFVETEEWTTSRWSYIRDPSRRQLNRYPDTQGDVTHRVSMFHSYSSGVREVSREGSVVNPDPCSVS